MLTVWYICGCTKQFFGNFASWNESYDFIWQTAKHLPEGFVGGNGLGQVTLILIFERYLLLAANWTISVLLYLIMYALMINVITKFERET